ncbi:hypothetical protein CR513_24006, partial [Mucuna pruriens]
MESNVEILEQQNQDLKGEAATIQDLCLVFLGIHVMGCRRDGTLKVHEEQEQQNVTSRNLPPFLAHKQTSQSEDKWQSLEEHLYAVEGGDKYRLEAVDMFLVPNIGLLIDFKTLEFDKYKGSSFPVYI